MRQAAIGPSSLQLQHSLAVAEKHLNKLNYLEALNSILGEEATDDKGQTAVLRFVCRLLQSTKDVDIPFCVDGLSRSHCEKLLRYLYKALESDTDIALNTIAFKWHERVVQKVLLLPTMSNSIIDALIGQLSPDMAGFCRELPKVELHAHLNGSVRDATIQSLLAEQDGVTLTPQEQAALANKGRRSLAEVFQIFATIHKITASHEAITRITREVLEDFCSDNVTYLELRSTPKHRPEGGMSKRSYVEAVLKGIHDFMRQQQQQRREQWQERGNAAAVVGQTDSTAAGSVDSTATTFAAVNAATASATSAVATTAHAAAGPANSVGPALETEGRRGVSGSAVGGVIEVGQWRPGPMLVRLLLSIDRREDAAAALETAQLAASLKDQGVVGVDLSGDPTLGSWDQWQPALQLACSVGLSVTLHAAELYNPQETWAMLAFRPARLGHMCFLDEELQASLLSSRIPVEVCLTSNVVTNSVPGYSEHHFQQLYSQGHPLVLCTDDSGVFGTSLSKEYMLAALTFGLTKPQLLHLAEQGISYCFLDDTEQEHLRHQVRRFRHRHCTQGF